jgi:sortase B
MEGGVMFGELPYFEESDYFQRHQTGTLFTAEHTYYIQWFACVETDAYDPIIYDSTLYTDSQSIAQMLDYIQSNATQYRDIGVSAADRIVALSTCSSAATDGRIILFGKSS